MNLYTPNTYRSSPVWDAEPRQVPTRKKVTSVQCGHCGAKPETECVTASGRPSKHHVARFREVSRRHRGGYFVVEARLDDPDFGITAGDLFVAMQYPLDGKVTLVFRLSDGFDPECNMYNSSVLFKCWVEDVAPPIRFQDRSGAGL